ncbi:MAG: hypothetical protein Q9197_005731 [Variospora fuerteventurae]
MKIYPVFNGTDVPPYRRPDTPCYILLATTTPPPPSDDNAARPLTPTFTAVILALIRLPLQSTDIVVTVNIPHIPGQQEPLNANVNFEEGNFGSLVEEGMRIRDEILKSLKAKDWGLFGPAEE